MKLSRYWPSSSWELVSVCCVCDEAGILWMELGSRAIYISWVPGKISENIEVVGVMACCTELPAHQARAAGRSWHYRLAVNLRYISIYKGTRARCPSTFSLPMKVARWKQMDRGGQAVVDSFLGKQWEHETRTLMRMPGLGGSINGSSFDVLFRPGIRWS